MMMMNRLKGFRELMKEYEDLGDDPHIFGGGSQHDHAKYKARSFSKYHKKPEDPVEPEDLSSHSIKPLSDKPEHADYTVHHVSQSDRYDQNEHHAALLHHRQDGFVGMLAGRKSKDGLHASESFVSQNHRKKGLGVALYEHAANHHGGVISDLNLTDASQRVYKHFAKQGRLVAHVHPNLRRMEPHTRKIHGASVKYDDHEMKFHTAGVRNFARQMDVDMKITPPSSSSSKKTFKEYFDIGSGNDLWPNSKPKFDAMKHVDTKKVFHKRSPEVSPTDLRDHIKKPLSDSPKHADYTVHHVSSENDHTALLHHKKDGFIGMLAGRTRVNAKGKHAGLHAKESFLSKEHRGKGLGVALYEHAAEHHGGVISDIQLSDGSQRIYAHFAKKKQLVAHGENPADEDHTEEHGKPIKYNKKTNTFSSKNIDDYANQDSSHDISMKIIPKKSK